MNTHDRHDDCPDAVRHADTGAKAWRAVVHAQLAATPNHADLYSLAGDLVDTLAAVEALAQVLHRQVTGYAATLVDGFTVYDDSRDGTRPVGATDRLEAAGLLLDDLTVVVATAGRHTNEFWSAIGHIGVEATR